MPPPLLILSDAPTSGTGLGRITRDLATRIAQHMPDTFRVATAGYAGISSRHLPFHQYVMEGVRDFVCPTLPDIWRDWAGDEKGILMTVWDLSRMDWLMRPDMNCKIPALRDFLLSKPFQTWGYLPIDASCPHNRLSFPLAETLKGVDRVLTYGKWAAGVVDNTMYVADEDKPQTAYLPHGVDSKVFYERNRGLCRKMFTSLTQGCTLMGNLGERIQKEEVLIGIVATNQARKDFAMGIEAVSLLAQKHKVRLWIKTDMLERHWSIPVLLVDYGLVDNTILTLGDMTDDKLAQAYSACDVTLGIGSEGFGYPIHESLFCGTPCITGDYAGAPEWMVGQTRQDDEPLLVKPVTYRYEGLHSYKRPVFAAGDWVIKMENVIGKRTNHNGFIDWENLWTYWERWLREGVK